MIFKIERFKAGRFVAAGVPNVEADSAATAEYMALMAWAKQKTGREEIQLRAVPA